MIVKTTMAEWLTLATLLKLKYRYFLYLTFHNNNSHLSSVTPTPTQFTPFCAWYFKVNIIVVNKSKKDFLGASRTSC